MTRVLLLPLRFLVAALAILGGVIGIAACGVIVLVLLPVSVLESLIREGAGE